MHYPASAHGCVKIVDGTFTQAVMFVPSHCVFHDLRTGHMIGGGRENNGLYILKKRSHGLCSLQWMKIMSCYGINVSNMNQFKVLGATCF